MKNMSNHHFIYYYLKNQDFEKNFFQNKNKFNIKFSKQIKSLMKSA